MQGWIKLHRSLLEWEWYGDVNTRLLFLHLLLTANHIPRKYRGIMINAGEIIKSVTDLSNETKMSIKQVRTSLDKLKSTNEVAIKTTNKYSVISINNWGIYQQNDKQVDNQAANKGQTKGKLTSGTKNDKNEKKEKNNNISLETFFSYFLKEGTNDVMKKSERFDLRDQDVNFFANECMEWYKHNSPNDRSWFNWDKAFNKWINDGIYLYKKKRTKTMRARDEEKASQPKKPKYASVEDYYLKEEGVTIIG